MTINEIIKKYREGEITVEEANKQLEAMDAGFTFDPTKTIDNPTGAWTEAEMEEGFFEAEPKAYTKYPEDVNMKKIPEFAGMTIIQKTKKGQFEVKYDELGYAVKATKI